MRSSETTDRNAGETTAGLRTRSNHRVVTGDMIPAATADAAPLRQLGARPQNAYRADDLVRGRIGTPDESHVPGRNAADPDPEQTGQTDTAVTDAAGLDNG